MPVKLSGTRKVQTKKTNYMSDEAFAALKQALEHALAFELRERRDLRITLIRPLKVSRKIAIRKSLIKSQL